FTLNLRNLGRARRELGVSLPADANFAGRHDWEGRRYAIGSGERRSLPFKVIAPLHEFSRGRREMEFELSDGHKTWTFKVMLAGPMGNPGGSQGGGTP
ncbi:MAG TPA: hypothetical protein VKZ88_02480, partial [Fibrobacteria bacterium]|nr:hypothetical protein [Fibrobacteria bacterium]